MSRFRQDPQDPSLAAIEAALTAPATPEELAGETAAVAAYRAVSWRTDSRWRPAVLATKLGVATAVGVLGLSGVATAAYTGSLPDTLQDVAHKTIKAPAAHPPAQAVGPDASGSAAYGLCQAFAKDKEHPQPQATATHEPQGPDKAHGKGKGLEKAHGKGVGQAEDRGQSKQRSVAYRNLVRAAGGEDKVAAYCAAVPKPSDEPDASEAPEDGGKPTSLPAHPTGKPTAAPGRGAGRPTELPAPAESHRSGPPATRPTPPPAG
jgi:hypothetical protein